MQIISTLCSSGPSKTRSCLAIFGVEYQTYLFSLLISLVIGFSLYFAYSKLRKEKIEMKNYLTKSLIISTVVFLIISLLNIYLQTRIIY